MASLSCMPFKKNLQQNTTCDWGASKVPHGEFTIKENQTSVQNLYKLKKITQLPLDIQI